MVRVKVVNLLWSDPAMVRARVKVRVRIIRPQLCVYADKVHDLQFVEY